MRNLQMAPGTPSSVLQLLSITEETLQTNSSDLRAYNDLLSQLGEVVQASANNENYRADLASSEELWARLKSVICKARELAGTIMINQEVNFTFVRTIRGLTLLLRNMSVCNQQFPQRLDFFNESVTTFLQITEFDAGNDEMLISYYTITVSFLHNITKEMNLYGKIALKPLMRFLEFPNGYLKRNQELSYCYAALFLNLTASEDFLYDFFREASCMGILHDVLLGNIINHHSIIFQHLTKVNDDYDSEITSLDAVLLKAFARLATNESFGQCLIRSSEHSYEVFFDVLKCLQLVITSTEKWDKWELTALMSWCFPIFERAAKSTIVYFEDKSTDEHKATILHDKLTMTMDIISTVAQYDHTQKFILSYNGLEVLIELLRVLQKNLIRINFYKNPNGTIKGLKTTDSVGSKVGNTQLLNSRIDYDNYHIKATNFPECKLLIIEILTTLVYNRKEIQDKVRELGGLELVLSNCVIDDNDPFIKERSVICIKFLLKDNALNQDFVAKLEAKQAVQDETLSAAGYEVNINGSGELKLNTIDKRGDSA